ncbi:hypothetical protein EYC84_005552 [Monilinia fructicola]|uniref:Uncharacterized protein n=1 Tax=Monilinia fructicola TaxID=38448 RepID=A0A5M9K1K8_MONFR|nr:hypothetical protein EYC84_005552 [Monilinia fructicola]
MFSICFGMGFRQKMFIIMGAQHIIITKEHPKIAICIQRRAYHQLVLSDRKKITPPVAEALPLNTQMFPISPRKRWRGE